MSRKIAALCAFAALWICVGAQATSVRAWLDRNHMQLGETVTLNVQLSGDARAQRPDFSLLQNDFDLTGTQSSSSVNIINGQSSSSVLWAVGLSPKHAGTFTIPALTVDGQQTQPLTLTVTAASANATQPGGDVFVETHVDPLSPYVQQQVLLTVKLYYAVNLVDGNLDDPQANGVVVRKLGQDSRYRAQMGGRNYNVVERHYALTPENNGSVSLPPIVFRGHAQDPSAGFFFSQGRALDAQSQPITLDVRPRPAASGTDMWLPARSMTLTATGIDATTVARVGEPLTLTLRLEAQGLGYAQLPKLELPKIDGADVYPDKSATQDKDDGQWLYGVRERKFAIVPNRPGALTLPPISVAWWDTSHDTAQTAQVPALTLNVQPAASSAGTPVAPAPAVHAPPAIHATSLAPTVTAPVVVGTDTSEARMWRSLAFVALALWALTVLAWILWLLAQRQRSPIPVPDPAIADSAPAKHNFAAACAREDLPATARALLAWARQSRPQLRNLGELAQIVSHPAQAAVLGDLERARYGGTTVAGLSATLARCFAKGPAFADAVRPRPAASALPALYPFDR